MRRLGFFGAIAAASMACIGAAAPARDPAVISNHDLVTVSAIKRRRHAVATGSLVRYGRSKNPQHRRGLRRNRLHLSRRVRRRHRRARAA